MLRLLTLLRKHPKTLRWCLLGTVAAAVVFDCFAVRHHPHFWGDHIRGFWAVFAFVGCISMIALFKGVYHVWLMKDNTHYDR